jgi:excisionase family DNA binding protein
MFGVGGGWRGGRRTTVTISERWYKVGSDHLVRQAIVYVRQSTADQVAHNLESQRRQYALVERARQLGWADVEVIDDDLGRSGSGVSRPGFEKLLAGICEGRVGAVVSIEASRLARNGRDWHTLLEFCGLVSTLIVDEDGVYDPRHPNDRLLLGMKGTMSEMELSVLRQRSHEALRQKARRGELFMTVAIGYVRVGRDRIEMDPDRRVRDAIGLVFAKFDEMRSVRQVHLWLRQEQISLPAVVHGPDDRDIRWKLPVYNTVLHILSNPIYAGAYVFGRTGSHVVIEDGRKRVIRGLRKPQEDWDVLIPDHHDGYISWDIYERNQRLIVDNATGKFGPGRGAIRRGDALLAGLLRCGHCGRKLHVAYSGKGGNTGRYHCRGSQINHGGARCISFGGMRVDRSVSAEIIARLQPLGIEAALEAEAAQGEAHAEKRHQLELSVVQARYEAARARRQYDAVDPDNRLVAGELEARWNARLGDVAALEDQIGAHDAAAAAHGAGAADRARLMGLGADIERAWESQGATSATRKQIIRTLVEEIIARVNGETIDLVIHWQGGAHSALAIRKNRSGQHRWSTDRDIVELTRALARLMPDKLIASALNRAGKVTGRGNGWTQSRVCTLRNHHKIDVYREGERQKRGELTLDEAAEVLALSPSSVRRLIQEGRLPAQQFCKGAPWIIKMDDLGRSDVVEAADKRRSHRPPSEDPHQKTLAL